jgi:hypothetical protein
MKKRITTHLFCYFLTLLAMGSGSGCSRKAEQQATPNSAMAEKIFGNGSDARLAQVMTKDQQLLTFFGTRDADGMPLRLTGYTIQSPSDPTQADMVALDKKGRFSDIFSRKGFKIHFSYSVADSVSLAILLPDNSISIVKPKVTSVGHLRTTSVTGASGRGTATTTAVQTLRIKVIARNTAGLERDLDNTSGSVFMDMVGRQRQSYTVPATYTAIATPGGGTGFFEVYIPADNFRIADHAALVKKTYSVIREGLYHLCDDGGSSQGSVADIILPAICALSPQTLVVCEALPSILAIACGSAGLDPLALAVLAKLEEKDIDEQYDINIDAPVSPWFTSSFFGRVNGTQTTIRQAVANQNLSNPFDIKIICTDKATIPILTTSQPTSITSNTAISGGVVSSDGGAPIIAKGVCWSTSPNPTVASSKTSNGTGTGIFTSTLVGLIAKTAYYVKAYATNSAGTAYGSQMMFTTIGTPPPVDGTYKLTSLRFVAVPGTAGTAQGFGSNTFISRGTMTISAKSYVARIYTANPNGTNETLFFTFQSGISFLGQNLTPLNQPGICTGPGNNPGCCYCSQLPIGWLYDIGLNYANGESTKLVQSTDGQTLTSSVAGQSVWQKGP